MLWVYGRYKYLILSARESTLVYRRQTLTSKDGSRTERVNDLSSTVSSQRNLWVTDVGRYFGVHGQK